MSQTNLISFVFAQKQNRRLAITAVIATLIEIFVFKALYPFPDFFSDSYSYIYAASAHLDISIWPIGYSKFLTAFHSVTHSDTAVVVFQYIFLEVSCMYFFFSILTFYNPGKGVRRIFFSFLFFNPLFLYISNYINSDSLFAALSICWITELLWIINRPMFYQLLTQTILLFLCFTVRNNAYYYPFITILAFALSKQALKRKLVGIVLPLLIIGVFILHTRNAAQELTGARQFSLFTGWQLANNALYMYQHIRVDSSKLPSQRCLELYQLSRNFYSHVPPDFDGYLLDYGANFFIQQPNAPLKQYLRRHYAPPKDEYDKVVIWGKVSVTFGEYGTWLISHYPLSYVRYFMLLNTKNYFLPSLEKLEVYNFGEDEVSAIAQDWFDYKTPAVSAISKNIQGNILSPYPYFFFFLNILFIGSIIWRIIRRKDLSLGWKLNSALILAGSFLLANFCFCVFATVIVMRYQFFPMIVILVFPLLLIELLDKKKITPEISSVHPEEKKPATFILAKL